MAVVKHQQAPTLLKEAIVLDLGDLGRQAARMRVAAEARAAQIIQHAEQEAARLVAESSAKGLKQGHEQGLARGLAEGREQGRAAAVAELRPQLEKLTLAWGEVVNQWQDQRKQITRDASAAVLELALNLAERVVHRVIEVDRTVIVDQVATTLAHLLNPMDPTVRIHPGDRPVLDEALPQLLAEFRGLEHVHLVDDASVTPGGCVVTSGQGVIDAQIDTQLRRIVELLVPDSARAEDAPAVEGDADIPEGMSPLDTGDAATPA